MKNYFKQYLTIFAVTATACLYSSCGDDEAENEVTPGRYPDSDFKKELNDASIRFTDKSHDIRYDNGGIMLTYSDGTDRDEISFLDIDSGSEIKLSWKGELRKGKLQEAVLRIDGVEFPDSEITVEQDNTKGVWISIQTPDGNKAVMVINI